MIVYTNIFIRSLLGLDMQYHNTTLEEGIEGIFEVGRESFSPFYSREKVLRRLKDKKYWIYVAKDDKIVGFKIFYEDEDGQLYDWLDGVKHSYRRKGIASKLMDMEIDFAKQEGYSKIKLKTHEGHPEMISLCKKFGFDEVRREPHHWNDSREAIFFELIIN